MARIPIRLAVRMTRRAISPRLATKTDSINVLPARTPGQPTPGGRRLIDPVLGDLELGPDGLDPDQHLGAQPAGRGLGAAALVHQPLHDVFQAVLAQARAALIEMLADLVVSLVFDLVVEVGVQAGQYLATRHLVGLAAAHSASFPGSSPDDDASVGAVDAARTRPSL